MVLKSYLSLYAVENERIRLRRASVSENTKQIFGEMKLSGEFNFVHSGLIQSICNTKFTANVIYLKKYSWSWKKCMVH
jgi:hypothetical protein